MKNLISDLSTLTNLDSISAYEGEVLHYVKTQLGKPSMNDSLGSLIYTKGNGIKFLIAAHVDEIGLMVKQIDNNGLIKFQPVGNILPKNILNQEWRLTTKNNKINGIMCYPSITEFKGNATDFNLFHLNFGFKSKDDAIKFGVEIGDMITPKQEIIKLNNNMIAAKGLNSRLGVKVLMDLVNEINGISCEFNAAFTVSDEVSRKGAKTVSYMVRPDIAISLNVGKVDDNSNDVIGPLINLYDNDAIGHHGLRNLVKDLAIKNNIKYKDNANINESSLGQMQLSHIGTIGISISIPVRNLNSHFQIVNLEDVIETKKLLKVLIENITIKTLDDLKK